MPQYNIPGFENRPPESRIKEEKPLYPEGTDPSRTLKTKLNKMLKDAADVADKLEQAERTFEPSKEMEHIDKVINGLLKKRQDMADEELTNLLGEDYTVTKQSLQTSLETLVATMREHKVNAVQVKDKLVRLSQMQVQSNQLTTNLVKKAAKELNLQKDQIEFLLSEGKKLVDKDIAEIILKSEGAIKLAGMWAWLKGAFSKLVNTFRDYVNSVKAELSTWDIIDDSLDQLEEHAVSASKRKATKITIAGTMFDSMKQYIGQQFQSQIAADPEIKTEFDAADNLGALDLALEGHGIDIMQAVQQWFEQNKNQPVAVKRQAGDKLTIWEYDDSADYTGGDESVDLLSEDELMDGVDTPDISPKAEDAVEDYQEPPEDKLPNAADNIAGASKKTAEKIPVEEIEWVNAPDNKKEKDAKDTTLPEVPAKAAKRLGRRVKANARLNQFLEETANEFVRDTLEEEYSYTTRDVDDFINSDVWYSGIELPGIGTEEDLDEASDKLKTLILQKLQASKKQSAGLDKIKEALKTNYINLVQMNGKDPQAFVAEVDAATTFQGLRNVANGWQLEDQLDEVMDRTLGGNKRTAVKPTPMPGDSVDIQPGVPGTVESVDEADPNNITYRVNGTDGMTYEMTQQDFMDPNNPAQVQQPTASKTAQAPGRDVDESKWEKAKEQAKKQDKDDNYAYITSIYKNMGGTFGSLHWKAKASKITATCLDNEFEAVLNFGETETLVQKLVEKFGESADAIINNIQGGNLMEAYHQYRELEEATPEDGAEIEVEESPVDDTFAVDDLVMIEDGLFGTVVKASLTTITVKDKKGNVSSHPVELVSRAHKWSDMRKLASPQDLARQFNEVNSKLGSDETWNTEKTNVFKQTGANSIEEVIEKEPFLAANLITKGRSFMKKSSKRQAGERPKETNPHGLAQAEEDFKRTDKNKSKVEIGQEKEKDEQKDKPGVPDGAVKKLSRRKKATKKAKKIKLSTASLTKICHLSPKQSKKLFAGKAVIEADIVAKGHAIQFENLLVRGEMTDDSIFVPYDDDYSIIDMPAMASERLFEARSKLIANYDTIIESSVDLVNAMKKKTLKNSYIKNVRFQSINADDVDERGNMTEGSIKYALTAGDITNGVENTLFVTLSVAGGNITEPEIFTDSLGHVYPLSSEAVSSILE